MFQDLRYMKHLYVAPSRIGRLNWISALNFLKINLDDDNDKLSKGLLAWPLDQLYNLHDLFGAYNCTVTIITVTVNGVTQDK